MTPAPKNIAASVRARLLAKAQAIGEDFNLVLQRYAVECLLRRVAASPHRDDFVLKGAMLFVAWSGNLARPTRDVDLLMFGPSDVEAVSSRVKQLCALDADDGVEFHLDTLRADAIAEEGEYSGIRVKLDATLDKARIAVQIDIGFGDAVEPPAQLADFPTLLDGAPPRVRMYPRESVIAEKLHAMVILGDANTRMKDFYDVFVLSQRCAFDGQLLTTAIAATFRRRDTALPTSFPASPHFIGEGGRAPMWRAFLEKNDLTDAPADFAAVSDQIAQFLNPIVAALRDDTETVGQWSPGGPWR